MNRVYRKTWGLFHNPAVRHEIESLDPERDVQRIVHLLSAYEFSWDLNRSLEVALFYTYGSAPVSRLLDRTGEFERYGQKRYDDTALLIGYFLESGWDGEVGRRAIERMNRTHGHFRIANDEFLFVLWSFIEFPFRWTDRHGRRRMSPHEKRAWFNFWREIGWRMGLTGIPETKAEFDAFIRRYEATTFVYAEASARVSDATVRIMENWLPPFLRFGVKRVVSCLMPDHFLDAVGYARPPAWQRRAVEGVLRLVGGVHRFFAFGNYPGETVRRKQRTYADGYVIEDLQPATLRQRLARRERRRAGATASSSGSSPRT